MGLLHLPGKGLSFRRVGGVGGGAVGMSYCVVTDGLETWYNNNNGMVDVVRATHPDLPEAVATQL